MLPAHFVTLAKLRAFCAAPPFDIFGRSADRKLERDLIAGYEKDVATVLSLLSVGVRMTLAARIAGAAGEPFVGMGQ